MYGGRVYIVFTNIAPMLYIAEDPCNSDPCMYGGTCFNETVGYSCWCVLGYKGDNCEIGRLH